MKNSLRKVSLGLSIGVFLYLCIPTIGFPAEPIKLKYASFMPPMHKTSQLAEQWCKELERRTDGRVSTSFFPAGTLVPGNQMYDGVLKGIIDIGFVVQAYTPGRFPLSEVIYLPMGYESGYQATKLTNEFYQQFKPKEYDDVKVFYLMAHGPGLIHTKKPVTKIDDLIGLRIKGNAESLRIAKAAGATPTNMPMMETYDGLKRGLADGVILPAEALTGWKFGEICKNTYLNRSMAYSGTFLIPMNKERWNSLPKDIQEIIDKMNVEWLEKSARVWSQMDDEAWEEVKKTGHNIHVASAADQAAAAQKMQVLIDEYLISMKKLGLPGEEALKWCREHLATTPVK